MLAEKDLAANKICTGMLYTTGDVILHWGCGTLPGNDSVMLRQITIGNSNHTVEAEHSEA